MELDAGRAFLRNVVLIDDQAFSPGPIPPGPAAGEIVTPPELGLQRSDAFSPPRTQDVGSYIDLDANISEEVDTAALVNAFADSGISCAVLAPHTARGQDRGRVVKLARRSDIVILDWMLQSEDRSTRETSRNLIREIAQADKDEGGRLRLLCIYTSDPALVSVHREVVEALSEVYGQDVVAGHSIDRFEIIAPHLRAVILAKAISKSPVCKVTESQLPSILINEFNMLAEGLLSGLALFSLGAIRDTAHQLVARFSADLDAAYLSHRALTDPVAAEQFAVQLVGDELSATLATAQVERLVHQQRVEDRIEKLLPEQRNPFVRRSRRSDTCHPVKREDAIDVLKADPGNRPTSIARLDQNGASVPLKDQASLTRLFFEKNEDADDIDHAFAAISCLARNPLHETGRGNAPHLTLGTLLLSHPVDAPNGEATKPLRADQLDGHEYLICIQPICDTVRLEGPTTFPMMPLSRRLNLSQKFDIVSYATAGLSEDKKPLRIMLSTEGRRIRNLKMIEFEPRDGVVQAEWDSEAKTWRFKDSAGKTYWWLGELRTDHGHRTAGAFGSALSRIGLDESEWLRLMAR
ncbi:response regulator receiver domain [Micromonospora zamorensis]|uniref:response regulator receiver domain n=1 Tax=Micromonospora zamorensis TaxID=709883 RepID=UPI002E2A993F|nr:response regulator receiver domain [Micromonospora zamorensis]